MSRDARRVRRRAFAAALAALTVTAAAGAAAAADPKAMVLRLGDLPAGFTLKNGEYVDNVEAAKLSSGASLADYVRWGRTNGYQAEYTRNAPAGLIDVLTRASTYKSAKGAQRSQEDSIEEASPAKAAKAGVKNWRELPTRGPIGDSSAMFGGTMKSGKLTAVIYVVQWRYRSVKSSLLGVGAAGTVTADQVVALARKQQAHMKSELG
jgi:hypothetical protein